MKSTQRRITYSLLLLLGLAWTFVSADRTGISTAGQVPAPQQGFLAPDFELKTTEGETIKLSDLRGQAVLVNLWATWCPPCKAEMPTLQAFHDKYADSGFTVIAINDGDPAADVVQFAKDYQLSFPVWLDPTYIATEEAFKTMNLPSSFVIDRSGTVRLYWVGEIKTSALEKYVTPIIKEKQ